MSSRPKIAIPHATIRDAIDWKDVNEGTPGDCPPGRIPVIRSNGLRAGHVGHSAGPSVAQRLLGRASRVELGTHQGKPAWRERGVTVAAQQTGALDKAVHAASLKAAKGSVGEPHKPEAHARPRRGG